MKVALHYCFISLLLSFNLKNFQNIICITYCVFGWLIKIKSDQIITAGGLLVAH